jgi:hypothetical protein
VSRSKVFVAGVVVAGLLASSSLARAQQPTAPPQQPTAPPAQKADESPQEPAWNLSGGYAYLYDGSWKEHLRLGFVASLTRRLTPTLSIVGEAGGDVGEYQTSGFTIQRFAFLGGVRLHAGEGEVRPFFQVLAGYSRQGGDVGLANGIAVQPGGGVDLVMSESITLRAQGDYRYLREDGQNYSQYRIAGGLVWYFTDYFKKKSK